MQITVNGNPHAFPASLTVRDLLTQLGMSERRVAVEVNREIVPRSQHDATWLNDGDRVELVSAIGGG